jgi:hypothetical protein
MSQLPALEDPRWLVPEDDLPPGFVAGLIHSDWSPEKADAFQKELEAYYGFKLKRVHLKEA